MLCLSRLLLAAFGDRGIIRAFASVTILILLLVGCGAIHNTGMPYTGKTQFGMASWYGGEFHGRITTCGEKYDMHKLTAAHRTLPFGTLVRVTNIKNGKDVLVRINDRGPWKPDRVVDLSYGAARKLKMVNDGVTRVRLDVIDKETGPKHLSTLHHMAICRHDTGQWINEMGRNLHERGPFPHRLAKSFQIEGLKIAKSAMNNFQAVKSRS